MKDIDFCKGAEGERWLAHCVFFGAGSEVVIWMQSMGSDGSLKNGFDWNCFNAVKQSVDEFERCLLDAALPKLARNATPLLYSSASLGVQSGFPGKVGPYWLSARSGSTIWSNWSGVEEATRRLSDRLFQSSLSCRQACGPMDAGVDLSDGPTPWPSSDCMDLARKVCESREQARAIEDVARVVASKRNPGRSL